MDTELETLVNDIQTRWIEVYAAKIKRFCLDHPNCRSCGLFNGVCRLDDIPADWDVHDETIHDGH